MKRILIAYHSESGATKTIAEYIAQTAKEDQITVLPVEKVETLDYDSVIIGTPNWYGKPAPAVSRFLRARGQELKGLSLAIYFSCMDCYPTEEGEQQGMLIYADGHFRKQTLGQGAKLSSWQKSHTVTSYVANLRAAVGDLPFQSLGLFKGRLDFQRLSWGHALMMRFICLINKGVRPGNYVLPEDITAWSRMLRIE